MSLESPNQNPLSVKEKYLSKVDNGTVLRNLASAAAASPDDNNWNETDTIIDSYARPQVEIDVTSSHVGSIAKNIDDLIY